MGIVILGPCVIDRVSFISQNRLTKSIMELGSDSTRRHTLSLDFVVVCIGVILYQICDCARLQERFGNNYRLADIKRLVLCCIWIFDLMPKFLHNCTLIPESKSHRNRRELFFRKFLVVLAMSIKGEHCTQKRPIRADIVNRTLIIRGHLRL